MKKQRIFLYVLYGLEILILYILQGTPGLIPELFGSKPLLLLPLAFSAASFENEIPSAVIGAVCGMFTDLGTGGIGYFAILMTIICFFESYLMRKYIISSVISTAAVSLLSIVLLVGGYFLIFFILDGIENSGIYFVNHYISRIFYTFVLIFPLYYFNRFLYRRLS